MVASVFVSNSNIHQWGTWVFAGKWIHGVSHLCGKANGWSRVSQAGGHACMHRVLTNHHQPTKASSSKYHCPPSWVSHVVLNIIKQWPRGQCGGIILPHPGHHLWAPHVHWAMRSVLISTAPSIPDWPSYCYITPACGDILWVITEINDSTPPRHFILPVRVINPSINSRYFNSLNSYCRSRTILIIWFPVW